MTNSERDITHDDEPQPTGMELEWVNLSTTFLDDLRARRLQEGLDVHPVEAISHFGDFPQELAMREIILDLAERKLVDGGTIPLVHRVDVQTPSLTSTRILSPIATSHQQGTRTIDGQVQNGGFFVFYRDNGASQLVYARARTNLFGMANGMCRRVGLTQFPEYTHPTSRNTVHLAPKR